MAAKRPTEPAEPASPAPAAPPTAPTSRPAAGVEEQAVVRFVETVAERAAAELAKRAAGRRRGEPGEPGG